MEIQILIILIFFSALFSGLTLGLLSLDPTELLLEKKIGNKQAAKILPIRQKGNFLLSTLILGNVAVNATIPLYLDSFTSGIIAGVISIFLITLFGEILPQAICAKHGLVIGAYTFWIIKIFMFFT